MSDKITDEMIEAGIRVMRKEQWLAAPGVMRALVQDIYTAMSQAHPTDEQEVGWQPMATAPKDGTWILALYEGDPNGETYWKGRVFEVRHEGETEGGYDLGWSLFPGRGGVPDRRFTGWMPSPRNAALNAIRPSR